MHRFLKGADRPSLLGSTLKASIAVGLLCLAAAHWLAGASVDRAAFARIASDIARGLEDPTTTGSLREGAAGTRLDPCTAPPRR